MQKKYIALICFGFLLLMLRIALPYIVLHYANKTLSEMNGYFGHIEDIDISLYRGAYIIKDGYLNNLDSKTKKQTDFFRSKNIDVSVEWEAIFNGALVGEMEFDSPVLIFTKDKAELVDVAKDTTDFRNLMNSFMPLKINRFEVINGEIHYADNTSVPKVDIFLKDTRILALNLSNAKKDNIELPSTVTAKASVYEGQLDFKMKLNPLAKRAAFDLNAEIKNTNLALLNDFLKAYGNFDVNKGNFGMYTEMAAKNGKFKGYVKPVITGLDVLGPEDKKDTFFHMLWEAIVGAVGEVFQNQEKDQLATKILIEGDFQNPETNTVDAVWGVLRNAFVRALLPSIDNEINIKSLLPKKSDDNKSELKKIESAGKKKIKFKHE